MSKKKVIFAAIVAIYIVLTAVMAWLSATGHYDTGHGTEPSPTPSADLQIADESEAAECLRSYLDSYASTSLAQEILHELDAVWECSSGYVYSGGGWEISIRFERSAVDGNDALGGIFQGARRCCESEDETYNLMPDTSCPSGCADRGVYYITVWLISADGLHAIPNNTNAELLLLALQEKGDTSDLI